MTTAGTGTRGRGACSRSELPLTLVRLARIGRCITPIVQPIVAQGRSRYFRLAGEGIAQLLETLMGISFRTGPVRPGTGPREPALRKARVCYDHLAGELSVLAYDGMLAQGVLQKRDDALQLTDDGRAWFYRLGIEADALAGQRRSFCRACLDWSERRDHLAGALGAALLARIRVLGWAGAADNSRAVVFTGAGERSFRALFTVATPNI